MSKISKLKANKTKLNKVKKGRVEKKKKINGNNGQKLKDATGKLGKRNGLKRRRGGLANEEDDDSSEIKKKPNKAELKSVIELLKKDASLVIVRKALKYIPYYLKSEGLVKKLLKEVIRLWSEAGEKIRVVCLLCLIRIYTKLKDNERKQQIIKQLYNSFLEKCRITKHETMSMIGFMRHSLVELYKLDQKIAFKQAQTSCQQLTVTLKNAYTHKNEETYKTVLNWQFANCLILLSNLITSQDDDSPIRTLTHQVIQLNLGALNIITSPRYYPYYCHLIDNLISLSLATNMFIPVLPMLIGILDKIQIPKIKKEKKDTKSSNEDENDDDGEDDDDEDEEDNEDDDDDDDDENENGGKNGKRRGKKGKSEEVKQYNMDLLNHVSLDEAHCLEYNVAVLEKIHELMLLYLASQCHRIAFPELVLLPCVQIKKWIKKNPVHPQTIKFKTLLEKIKTDSAKVEEARRSVDFAFTNYSAVDAWEKKMRDTNKLVLPKLVEKTISADT